MKKILYSAAALFFMLGGLASCGDNDDFSKAHTLTAEEIASMEEQERIKDSLRQVINANLVLKYEVTDYISADSWTSQRLDLDMTPVAELFGLTVQQVYDGINGIDGAPNIVGFAIDGTTHNDYSSASTSSGPWGHWWNTDCDVTTWGNGTLAFYCEWQYWGDPDDPEDGTYMLVGQLPGTATAPVTYVVYECLKYQDYRVAFEITYNLIERGAVVASIVNTQDLEITLPQNPASYDVTGLKFDLAQTLSDIGASSLNAEDNFVTYDENGQFVQGLNADYGFWMDKNGYKGSWGDDAGAWISYGAGTAEDEIGVCLMPGANETGDVYVMKVGFMNGSKIEMLSITITVGDATVLAAEVVGRQDLTVEMAPNDVGSYDPTPVAFDLAKALADTGLSEITTSNITAYDMDGNLMTYTNADGGFWYDKSGPVGGWGDDASAWISYGITEDPATIGVCLMPGTTAAGDVYEHDFYIINENVMEQLHVTINVTEFEDPEDKPGTTPADATTAVELNIEWADWWPDAYFDVRDLVRNAFNLTTYEVMTALNNDELKVYLNEIGDGVPAYNANHGEYWIGFDGALDAAGWPDAPVYTGFYADDNTIEVGAGINSDVVANEAASLSYKLIALYNGTTVTFDVTLNITPGAESSDEAPARKVRSSKAGRFTR